MGRKRKKPSISLEHDEDSSASGSDFREKHRSVRKYSAEIEILNERLVSLLERLPAKDDFDTWQRKKWSSVRNSWRDKTPHIVPHPYRQKLGNCWVVAVQRHYESLLTLKKIEGYYLRKKELMNGVSHRYQTPERGLERMESIIPFFLDKGLKSINIHHKPNDPVGEENFERFLLELLDYGPLSVCDTMFPSYIEQEGLTGILAPTDLERLRFRYEDFTKHVSLLIGDGVDFTGKEPRAYWEHLESAGNKVGEMGFVRRARHQGLLYSAVEMRV